MGGAIGPTLSRARPAGACGCSAEAHATRAQSPGPCTPAALGLFKHIFFWL